jgi:membrane protein
LDRVVEKRNRGSPKKPVIYTVFSLAPLVLLLLGIFGLIYGSQQAREKILEQLRYLMDPNAVKIVEDIANNAAQPKPGIIATAIGILIALFGASGIFGQLQDALNTIWSTPLSVV